ncbi:MAG: V-type ATP synthase subunit I, partial [Acetanaerobacterium sp.]
MAVVTMRRVNICGLQKDRKEILETLQRLGVVEISDTVASDSVFEKTDSSAQRAVFEKNVQYSSQALEVLDAYVPEKQGLFASLQGRQPISVSDYDAFGDENPEMMRVAYHLNALAKEIAEKKAENLKLEAQREALVPWLSLPVSLRYQGGKSTYVFTGAVASELALDEIYARCAQQAPDMGAIHIDIISATKEQTCILAVSHRGDAALLEDALRAIGFARPAAPPRRTPAEQSKRLEDKVRENLGAIGSAEAVIRSYSGVRRALRFMMDYFTLHSEKYKAVDSLLHSRHAFVLSGYIPAPAEQLVQETLERDFEAAVSVYDPQPKEDVPVLVKNNAFSAPVEGVLESFSLPGRGELDPTGIMSFFYYLLFGMMLSDAGYGLLMVIACGAVLLKFRNMEQPMKNTIRMFLYCGISTIAWGVVFSSYFGDVVNVVSRTFFGNEVGIAPLWFSPVKDPMRMLMFSLAVGVVHLFSGLGVKLYTLVKAGKIKDAVYDVVFWYMLVGGAIVFLLSAPMFVEITKLAFILPASAGMVGTVAAG